MGSLLHDEIANIDPKNCTPEELDKYLNDPLLRNLQYQIQHGVRDIKLETNKGEHKINNICIPEGANQEEYIQKMMAEQQRNEAAAKKEEARKKEVRANFVSSHTPQHMTSCPCQDCH